MRCLRMRAKATVAAMTVAAGLMAFGTAPAAAHTAANGATWFPIHLHCDPYMHMRHLTPHLEPQAGWNSQWVAMRVYVWDLTTNTAIWTTWTQFQIVRGQSEPTWANTMQAGHTYRFYGEHMWWDGSAWTNRVGDWATYSAPGVRAYVGTSCRT
jgi:hypothetical protein